MTSPTSRLLVVGLNYAPEPTGIAPYTTKLAEALSTDGWTVRVISGRPHYPGWRVTTAYGDFASSETRSGVRVDRVRHYVPAAPSGIKRVLMELTFGAGAIFRKWGRPDVILVVTPGLFSSALAVAKARVLRIPVGIWVQDLYSRGVQETGGGGTVAKILKLIESRILRSASGVSVIHERFRRYLIEELSVDQSKIEVIRNWTHVAAIDKVDVQAIRRSYGWEPGVAIALHAGNMGSKQGLENVVEAARAADAEGLKLRFVLMGDGHQRSSLERQAAGVRSIEFTGAVSDQDYGAALRAADVLLLNELAGVREMSVPSKLTSYFSSGTPVLAATSEHSASADEIQASGAGIRVDPGRPRALARAVRDLASNPDLSRQLGEAGVAYSQSVLSATVASGAYRAWLAMLANSDSRNSLLA